MKSTKKANSRTCKNTKVYRKVPKKQALELAKIPRYTEKYHKKQVQEL